MLTWTGIPRKPQSGFCTSLGQFLERLYNIQPIFTHTYWLHLSTGSRYLGCHIRKKQQETILHSLPLWSLSDHLFIALLWDRISVSMWALISYFGMNCFCVVVTGDKDAQPYTPTLPIPSSFGGILYHLKCCSLRLHSIFSNNLKHFKKYRIMHSHHLKPYDKETNRIKTGWDYAETPKFHG